MEVQNMKFRDWVIEMNRIVRSLRPIEGSNIVIERTPKGSVFHAKAGTGGDGSSGYEGPFKVEKSSGLTVSVLGYNAADGRYWRNLVFLGDTSLEVTDGATCLMSGNEAYVCLVPAYSESYSVTLQSKLYSQVDSSMFPLAFVRSADGEIESITQFQYGIINHGRIW
jgi:hypothetical protein